LYANEPGALNENFSDIFAACIENTYKPNTPDNWRRRVEYNFFAKQYLFYTHLRSKQPYRKNRKNNKTKLMIND
jgi:Zn-dependent metalloprotease